ncbi:nuclear transport factor 2 family protein [Amycolatopsis sp. SID8362]|uniref:nuclear transport factor 2 family protein n=1 Tax=Amycolatopsis sp. SID8362 TaxID=2690346 RepID=UPI001370039D|nr:nuclear transport factor 2 family protein [Amycolatopsis sp. SID8362]NBH02964.1 nuclear transport factor 2 family protein [Amycolatopsis sp. SID8362]NED39665.1 nuclear transport factor 2 family protein [Amycolatopsis sp. SID8362]
MPDWPCLHKQAVHAFAAGWAAPGPHAWDDLLADDVELNQPMLAPARGRAHWQAEAGRLVAFLPDLRGDVLDWAGREDTLFITWQASATLAGKPLTFRAVDQLWLDERGKVLRRDAFFDSAPLARQVLSRPATWPRWWRSGVGPLLGRRRFLR